MIRDRGSGILLHITSLPSPYGIGDLGPGAFSFADFLAKAGQSFWQVLPLCPTDSASGNSPYSSNSAFAGNILLISPELLVVDGFLSQKELKTASDLPADCSDYQEAIPYKIKLLDLAYDNFRRGKKLRQEFSGFCLANSSWLDNFAVFVVLKTKRFGWTAWGSWDSALRDRQPKQLEAAKREYVQAIEREKFFQYIFYKQWSELRKYCNSKGVKLIGDIPIYVSYDSADVWEHRQIFKLDENGQLAALAGVPPDYFSRTGQLWGNPVYRWEVLKQQSYKWWLQRLEHNLGLYDVVRIDHFRGFVSYWEVPAGEVTAVNGRWVKAPAEDFFAAAIRKLPDLDLIAEDLGTITDEVKEIMTQFGFPGMKILLFAFGGDLKKHPYLPHNYSENCVVYTGTHDNSTVRGWYENIALPHEKKNLAEYLGHCPSPGQVNWDLIKLALNSEAKLSIFPLQDILGLGNEARMNVPSQSHGNWQWRVLASQLDRSIAERLRQLTILSKRD
ncbi:4-alpha-glucanotransferase [candidate division WOR-1 bacterium RIFCSPLOWO2_02_FULL_46_20]|uniref:4-alpha-glucanotransferase n=1 Tax=candidate division WOR-1 bacterium RIFCSPLOWO2_02_FULL_46_20 TaxID=1802567 RepID=A0A1F4RAW3_UNCSA|nr:MAG: 4-alpha-glucanotransferase [candidate division WOR-1 bacterium RIFCSPHIGHO2_02_FULL_45_12]OGC05305.1 MAG: 4-alpha-glucanotransferase [candidate division WOR-1 bacterium RIFCSPLOWO2_02_FULL_46_20]